MFHKHLDEAWAGENCGLLLRGTKRDDVERGQVVVKPGSVTPHTNFEGTAYILSKDEGGRHNPFFTNYRPQFYFRSEEHTSELQSLMRISYAVFCLKKKKTTTTA